MGKVSQIQDRDLASLAAKLEAPVVISKLLRKECHFDHSGKGALNEILCELPLDKALLAIALSTQIVLEHAPSRGPIDDVLLLNVRNVISDYGQNVFHQNDVLTDNLDYIAEDLETFSDLLRVFVSGQSDSDLKVIAAILEKQARAHADIANTVLEMTVKADEISENQPYDPEITGDAGATILAFPQLTATNGSSQA